MCAFEMLLKLLDRSGAEEAALADCVAPALATATGSATLPVHGAERPAHRWQPVRLGAQSPGQRGSDECPVVYVEPYVMNSPEVFRAGAGRRLRGDEGVRRGAEEEYLPRVRRRSDRGAGGFVLGAWAFEIDPHRARSIATVGADATFPRESVSRLPAVFFGALCWLAAALPVAAGGDYLYPKDAPAFNVALPEGWTIKEHPGPRSCSNVRRRGMTATSSA